MSAIGKYINGRGVELEVTGYRVDRNIIGTVLEAVIPDQLFGPRYVLLTLDGLADSGYERIDL